MDKGLPLQDAPAYANLPPDFPGDQPWEVSLEDSALCMTLRGGRAARAADTEELVECGAALENLRIAVRHFGWAEHVDLFPEGERAPAIARITEARRRKAPLEDEALFSEMKRRRSPVVIGEHRGSVSPALLSLLRCAARRHGAWLVPVQDKDARGALVDRFFREASDSRGEATTAPSPAGPAASVEHPALTDVIAILGGASPPPPGSASTLSSIPGFMTTAPLLAVIGATRARPADWVQAGEALQRVNLHASLQGFVLSVLRIPLPTDREDGPDPLHSFPGEPLLVARFDFAVPPSRGTRRRGPAAT